MKMFWTCNGRLDYLYNFETCFLSSSIYFNLLHQDSKDSKIDVGKNKSEISLELYTVKIKPIPYQVTLGRECQSFLDYKSYSNFTIDCGDETKSYGNLKVCRNRYVNKKDLILQGQAHSNNNNGWVQK